MEGPARRRLEGREDYAQEAVDGGLLAQVLHALAQLLEQAVGLGPEIVNQTIFLIQGGAQIFILFFNLVFVCKLPAETRGTAMF